MLAHQSVTAQFVDYKINWGQTMFAISSLCRSLLTLLYVTLPAITHSFESMTSGTNSNELPASMARLVTSASSMSVRLNVARGNSWAAGTGFYITDSVNLYFVTARHMLFDTLALDSLLGEDAVLTSHVTDLSDTGSFRFKLSLDTLKMLGMVREWDSIDVAVINLGTLATPGRAKGTTLNVTARSIPVILTTQTTVPCSSLLKQQVVMTFGYNSWSAPEDWTLRQPALKIGRVIAVDDDNHKLTLDYPGERGLSGAPVLCKVDDSSSIRLIGVHVGEIDWVFTKERAVRIASEAVCIERVMDLIAEEWGD